MQARTLIFVGPQGSGKGTQIKKLLEVLAAKNQQSIVHIETGKGFRSLIADPKTFAERKVAASLERGELQPDFLTYILWGSQMLKELDASKHLVIDGFPRTLEQAAVLDEALRFFERAQVDIINLDTPDAVVKERMLARGRKDDSEESIMKRLAWYQDYSVPVLSYYRSRPNTQVHDINGALTIDEVHEEILTRLSL